MYLIWHDNDYDFALWVYENTILKNEEVKLRQIPKTKEGFLILSSFKEKADFNIFPYIKFATPDILIQKVDNNESRIVFASEFMTHTPQHDHVFQRFERIYAISKERVPIAFILPGLKVKIEKGSRSSYQETKYRPNPLAIHTYLKTTIVNNSPALTFFWPDLNGYLKYDDRHQTAPKIEDQIIKWIDFANECIKTENVDQIIKSDIVGDQLRYMENKFPLRNRKTFLRTSFNDFMSSIKTNYNLDRLSIVETNEIISRFGLVRNNLSNNFLKRKHSAIFSYNSKTFRTDPYCGFICGFKNLFCLNNNGEKVLNLILIPNGIKYSDISQKQKNKYPCFEDTYEDLNTCPAYSESNLIKYGIDTLIKHLESGCIFSRSKQQRIFGTIPDLVIFDDHIYYNRNEV